MNAVAKIAKFTKLNTNYMKSYGLLTKITLSQEGKMGWLDTPKSITIIHHIVSKKHMVTFIVTF